MKNADNGYGNECIYNQMGNLKYLLKHSTKEVIKLNLFGLQGEYLSSIPIPPTKIQ